MAFYQSVHGDMRKGRANVYLISNSIKVDLTSNSINVDLTSNSIIVDLTSNSIIVDLISIKCGCKDWLVFICVQLHCTLCGGHSSGILFSRCAISSCIWDVVGT